MDNLKNWEKYNKRSSFLKKVQEHNNLNYFNYLEDNLYNHIRDLMAIVISLISKKDNEKIEILDYGSNLLSWVNIKNKIKTDKFNLSIYDPFEKAGSVVDNDFGFTIKTFNNLKKLNCRIYDLTVFGSVIQYDEHFFNNIIKNQELFGKYVLITHTPFSLGDKFFDSQPKYGFKRFFHSFNNMKDKFEYLEYDEIFKSIIPANETNPAYDLTGEKYINLNILFRRNDISQKTSSSRY